MTSIIRIKYSIPSNANERYSLFEGVDKEILVNINCPLKLILNYIRNVVGLDDTVEFDLCDEITCQLRKVSFFEPHTVGFDVFQADLTYLIVTFERKLYIYILYKIEFSINVIYTGDINGQMINITPLLGGKAGKRCTEILLKPYTVLRKNSSKSSLRRGNYTNRKT
ncbi:hypothetical protein ANTRET_LOCUS7277 [Anthophora retusa]